MKKKKLITRKLSREGIPHHKDLYSILGHNPFPDYRLTVAHYEPRKSQAEIEAFLESYRNKVIVYEHLKQRKHDGFWIPSRFPRVEVNFVLFSDEGLAFDLNHSPGIVIPTPECKDIEHCIGLYFLPTNGNPKKGLIPAQAAVPQGADEPMAAASQPKALCLEWGIINERERYQRNGQLLFLGGWYHS